MDFQVWHETPDEGQGTYFPKHYGWNNEDEVNSLNILSNNKSFRCIVDINKHIELKKKFIVKVSQDKMIGQLPPSKKKKKKKTKNKCQLCIERWNTKIVNFSSDGGQSLESLVP